MYKNSIIDDLGSTYFCQIHIQLTEWRSQQNHDESLYGLSMPCIAWSILIDSRLITCLVNNIEPNGICGFEMQMYYYDHVHDSSDYIMSPSPFLFIHATFCMHICTRCAHGTHSWFFWGWTWGARLPKEANRMNLGDFHDGMVCSSANVSRKFQVSHIIHIIPYILPYILYHIFYTIYCTIKIKGQNSNVVIEPGTSKKNHRNHRPVNTLRPLGMSYSAAVRLQPPWLVCQIAHFFVLIFFKNTS